MVSRIWLFSLLLAVPLVGLGVSEAIQAYSDSELRSAVRAQNPGVTDQQVRQLTVDTLCEQRGAEFDQLCARQSHLNLLSGTSAGAGAAGLILLGLIMLAGRLARDNRSLLLAFFKPGLYVTTVVLTALILVHAAIAMAAIYYGEAALIRRVHVGIVGTIALGALAGVVAMAQNTFTLVRKARTFVVGSSLTREQAPLLWNEVDATARRLGALQPQNVVVGLDPNFFVTEAEVVCLDRALTGRTLYCSLPLCRILSKPEFTAIIGHELGHFQGQDTRFSASFYPIYRGTASSIHALSAAGGGGSGSIAIFPALAILSFFMECFSLAESRLGRDRELAADKSGAGITTPRTIAAALAKLHAFTGVWHGLREASESALREGRAFTNTSLMFSDAVGRVATPEALQGLTEIQLSHPTDSHPPLSARLDSLQIRLGDIAEDALKVAPAEPAIGLIPDAEKREEEISTAYQVLLARKLGIDIENLSNAGEIKEDR